MAIGCAPADETQPGSANAECRCDTVGELSNLDPRSATRRRIVGRWQSERDEQQRSTKQVPANPSFMPSVSM
jgi:hypothetical protein